MRPFNDDLKIVNVFVLVAMDSSLADVQTQIVIAPSVLHLSHNASFFALIIPSHFLYNYRYGLYSMNLRITKTYTTLSQGQMYAPEGFYYIEVALDDVLYEGGRSIR